MHLNTAYLCVRPDLTNQVQAVMLQPIGTVDHTSVIMTYTFQVQYRTTEIDIMNVFKNDCAYHMKSRQIAVA